MTDKELLAALPHTNPNPVMCCSCDGVVQWCNAAARQLQDSLDLDGLVDLVPPEHTELVERCHRQGTEVRALAQLHAHTISWVYAPAARFVNLYAVDTAACQVDEPVMLAIDAVLDFLHTGVAFIDVDLRILHLNNSAHSILSQEGILLAKGTCLLNQPNPILLDIAEAVKTATQVHTPVTGPSRQVLSLRLAECGQFLEIMVVPWCGTIGAQSSTLAMLFLFHPGSTASGNAEMMRILYDLTSAEAKLAAHLSGGCSLRDAADQLGVKIGTVRTQLSRIFRKTNTTRQPELVNRILTGAAGLSINKIR